MSSKRDVLGCELLCLGIGGCGTFYAISISSAAFKGLPTVKQHRLVNETLKKEIEGIHGLQASVLDLEQRFTVCLQLLAAPNVCACLITPSTQSRPPAIILARHTAQSPTCIQLVLHPVPSFCIE